MDLGLSAEWRQEDIGLQGAIPFTPQRDLAHPCPAPVSLAPRWVTWHQWTKNKHWLSPLSLLPTSYFTWNLLQMWKHWWYLHPCPLPGQPSFQRFWMTDSGDWRDFQGFTIIPLKVSSLHFPSLCPSSSYQGHWKKACGPRGMDVWIDEAGILQDSF